ncbi:multidrug resistance protein ABC transporter family [Linderina pennispora]|uniref:Multidrug resistance protein ABC transporter family n=1 Tax=Linderina pennispora TaxID=61395 RepID=A0A1Y1W2H3_9FUNG|nr:multidrug resistance protein ABC transporter family [Linderina pennispora]ORX67678.1 multidrug resistance protein ABC transporter family [Linderina pennispora]
MARFQHLTHKSYTIRTGFSKSARYIHYSRLKTEQSDAAKCEPVGEGWPARGQVVFDNVTARYNVDGKRALSGMSFTIRPGQHVSVVGRTGAGKTSIAMALFGLLKPSEGRILIDGVDIGTVDLHALRSRLGVVPQTSVLLTGTVRDNLDPFRKHADSEIQRCLIAVGMSDVALDSPVLPNGSGWSVGQQQQICLARALLKRPKVLVLDESTAAIDSGTSNLLHQLIRDEFAGCTVISIAHRVENALGSDMVLVVEDGKICESGTPDNLRHDPESHFAQLVKQSVEKADPSNTC